MGEAAAAHLVVAEQGVVEGVGGVGVRLHAATALDHGVRELVRVVLVEACGFVLFLEEEEEKEKKKEFER